jgi:hypothetical protein
VPAAAAAEDPASIAAPVAADLAEVPGVEGLSQEQIQALANISFDRINEVYSQRMAEALAIYQAAKGQYTKERDFALSLVLQRNAARLQQILGQLTLG